MENRAFSLEKYSLTAVKTKLWILTFDLPGEKVNKLSRSVMMELREKILPELESLGQKKEIDCLIFRSGKAQNFLAGADIELIQSVKTEQEGQELCLSGHELFNRWEDLAFPTVAVVQGPALGGGCEWLLSCRAIVASNDDSTRIGLPEVLLGVIPGLGGCIRLPRKIGIAQALDLILTGKTLTAEKALKAGLVEACLPKENFFENSVQWTLKNLDQLKSPTRIAKPPKLGGMGGVIGKLLEKTPLGKQIIFNQAKKGVLSKTKGQYPAPLAALSVIRENGFSVETSPLRGQARERAQKREAQAFGKLAVSSVSKNLIRLFFLTEKVKKDRGIPSSSTVQAREVQLAGVLGAGVMGGGIAHLLANRGIPSRMKDLNSQALGLGVQAATRLFSKDVQKRKLTKRQAIQKLNLIAPTLDFSGFQHTDVVIEAIIEKLEIKQKVFKELEDHVSDRTVIASNTSSLSISKMQSVLKHPERFVGMHFFNPVHRMPLVEVIRGEKSSDEAVATIFSLSKKLGKTPIVVKDAPGFLVNRLLMPYMNEATWLLADGVSIPDIDRVLLDFGMPMGPMELIDEVGVDVGEKVAHILYEAFGPRMEPAPFNKKIVEAGRLGKKNGKGLYVYEAQARKGRLDPEIYKILGLNPKSNALSDEEILDRSILPMINEASRCLEEQIVESPAQVDLGMIMGTGFPPYRGGVLRYADSIGIEKIVKKLESFSKKHGARYEPASALIKMAKEQRAFYSNE